MARKSRKHNNEIFFADTTCQNKTAIYVRLSSMDNGHEEGTSIETQVDYIYSELEGYPDINIVEVYKDNGYSGTNFNRDGWNKLISDIKAKKINCIAVKDLSRLGRNAVEAGNYLETVFPFLGVRFISVNDGYDSSRDNYSRVMLENSFKNIMNEFYARDISKKIKSGIDARRKMGYIFSNNVPYGYKKSHDNRSLVLDFNAAPVVKKIFEWRKKGKRLCEIIKILNNLAIPSPGKYLYLINNGNLYKKYANSSWSFANVKHILSNKTYVGDLIQGKTLSSVFEGKKKISVPESQWFIVENAHPALVSKEDFDFIQSLKSKTYIEPKNINPLKGKIFCGHCGYKMQRIFKSTDKTYYNCISHKTQIKEVCNNILLEKDIDAVLSETLKKLIYALINKAELVNNIKNSKAFRELSNTQDDEIKCLKNKISIVNFKLKELYSDLKQGIISKNEFIFIKEKYNKDLADYNSQLQLLITQTDKFNSLSEQNKRLDKLVKDLDNLSKKDIYSLVRKITVYKDKRIHIEFNFTDSFSDLLSLEMEVSE